MKKIASLLFLIYVAAISVFGQDNKIPDKVASAFMKAGLRVAAEAIAPVDFTLPLLDGTNIKLSQYKGKVVFLNFWATWCPPCRSEMPSMEAIYQRLKSRKFEMLELNIEKTKKEVSSFMNQHKLSFPVVLDEKDTVSGNYGIQAIPTTYIIDKRGLIIARLVGSINWNTPEVLAALEAALQD
jgi:peroxiredoxin